jgi:hypothetical protein
MAGSSHDAAARDLKEQDECSQKRFEEQLDALVGDVELVEGTIEQGSGSDSESGPWVPPEDPFAEEVRQQKLEKQRRREEGDDPDYIPEVDEVGNYPNYSPFLHEHRVGYPNYAIVSSTGRSTGRRTTACGGGRRRLGPRARDHDL